MEYHDVLEEIFDSRVEENYYWGCNLRTIAGGYPYAVK